MFFTAGFMSNSAVIRIRIGGQLHAKPFLGKRREYVEAFG
jgi:hypothetical protein